MHPAGNNINYVTIHHLHHHHFSHQVRHYDAAAASILSVSRGGAVDVDDLYDEEYDEEYDSDADFDLDFEDMDMEANEGDFAENNTLERAWESWKKTPPFTQMYISLSIGATMLGFLTNNNEFPKILSLEWKPTLTKLQLWRPFTSFLNIGAFNLGYLMTAHFVWTYMSTLERLNHDKPYDFWLMIVFGCVSMVTGYSLLGLSPRFLGHNLSTFFVYVWSRYHEGLEVNMMELFNTRAEMLPWFFLAQTALLEGELPLLDMLGIVFGHIYHYCKTTNAIRTPKAVINWYMSDSKYSNMIR
eukprot:CAMPEP_0116036032 /NCGR_PEP_ID=MMETSP0321-20121206/20851_1 /TAXON_ID=163516 /ORGANISM="Leptocylindrus danicus var. danicus, Strain B650" /LENGTH=299 /DNA_ID=CAMNT_0003513237 /DNA_START=113 /DNA_END=1008 /DNA_ORIENTATION=+